MKSFSRTTFLLAACLLGLAVSCKKDPGPEDSTPFDKGAMLTNIADNIIIPAIDDFSTKINALESDYLQFQADRSSVNLETVRESWKAAYLSWQAVKIFDFGPVRDNGFKGATGTFPTDTVKIEDNVAAGSYNLGSVANADAIGLPALDFLLYRVNALSYFVGNDPYTTYGLDVIQKMRSELTTVQSAWTGYRATFIAATGTSTTSAFSELINEFNRDYELAKNAKVGIPIGKQSLEIQLPEYIEARQSGFSFELLRESVHQIYLLYFGCDFNTGAAGLGFDDYLNQLDRTDLSATIGTNFQNILNKIDSFSGTLEEEMATNVSGLDELYNLLQGQVVYLKTDMTSAFGVLITYQDNDGD